MVMKDLTSPHTLSSLIIALPGLVILCLSLVSLPGAWAQQEDECPENWYEHSNRCYKFVQEPTTIQRARIECQQDWATLVKVHDQAEHAFLQSILEMKSGVRLVWFTSGYRAENGKLLWSSDNTEIQTDFFPSPAIRQQKEEIPGINIDLNQIVYKYNSTRKPIRFVWGWSRIMTPGGFICQIDKSDTWKIYQQRRDFSYGTNNRDPATWKMGPNITYFSPTTLFFEVEDGLVTPFVLDCQAVGNPRPTYRWYRQADLQSEREEVTSALGPNYVVTNGRLTITEAKESKDAGLYTCEATNEIGTVQSNPIEVSYRFLAEFSTLDVAATNAIMFRGVEISCQNIEAKADLAYNWFKQKIGSSVRPEFNPQYFISKNGKLYISEVQDSDQATYHCVVSMIAQQGEVLASNQSPSRISKPIKLNVLGGTANDYGPEIQDKFPQFFPSVPEIGDRVEIECLAYGRLPIYYSWKRLDGQMGPHVQFTDNNRRLVIPRARLEDTGIYACVARGPARTETKKAFLSLKARPSFPYPLENQHLDKGSDFTWRCLAVGVPLPTYTWLKNGEKIMNNTDKGVKVVGNVLTITGVDVWHEGMYQCEAINTIGMARSSAQLRSLNLAPTFQITPVVSSKQGAVGGSVTIACQPQAAPRAIIRWEKGGLELDTVLANGDLMLTDLSMQDAGRYTCVATNALGEARSSCILNIQAQSVFTEEPDDRVILVNESTTLACKASFDPRKSDVIYTWTFNNHVIDFTGRSDDSVTYSMPNAVFNQDGRLYITNAKFKHEGMYTCHVTSVTGSISSGAYLTIHGPPGEPGGVHARGGKSDVKFQGQLELWWQDGPKRGFDVSYYIIEYRSYFDPRDKWTVWRDDIPHVETAITLEKYQDWRGFIIKGGLSPGSAYYFRVTACNSQVGCSPPSGGPYEYYNMASAEPIYPPENVGGGGGAEGLLQIKWDPLPRSKWGSQSISYIMYYRMKSEDERSAQWTVIKTKETYYNKIVGLKNFYLPYTVKVQAVNPEGSGPNSTEVTVMSAEGLPEAQPMFQSAGAINATAGMVYWIPVPATREKARGEIGGYQINYWQEGPQCKGGGDLEAGATSVNIYGDVGEGMVVGLDAGSANCLNMQYYNAAGLGPKTDNYYLEMTWNPPSLYPEYVTVISQGRESVRLFWKGVSIRFGEEPIRGYSAWFWEVTENIRAARVADFGMSQTGVIHGIEKDRIYRLRMLAYSKGGNGTKSTDVFFTLGGQVAYDPLTSEIRNGAERYQQTYVHFLLVIAGLLIWFMY